MAFSRQTDRPANGAWRKLVLLLGMHRSGTSVAAQAFARAGLQLGDRLALDPVSDNAGGYWEDEDIVRVHSALLVARFGEREEFGLPGLEDALVPDSPSPGVEQARAQLLSILFARLAAASQFGFKDPRTARFLPLWKRIAEETGVELVPVLLLRGPAAVAASLKARDGIRPDVGELMWLRSVVDVVRHVGEQLVAVISYENWFERPELNRRIVARTLAAAGVDELSGWRLPTLEAERHEGSAEPSLPLAGSVHRLLASCGEDAPSAAKLKEILERVDHVLDAFGGWSAFGEATARLRRAPRGDTLILSLPFSDDGEEPPADRFDPGLVALIDGNAGCRHVRGGFVLRADPPGGRPAQIWWRGFRAPKPANLTGTLVARCSPGTSVSVRMSIRPSDGEGREQDFIVRLGPDESAPLDVELPGAAYLDIRLAMTTQPAERDADREAAVLVRNLRATLVRC